MRKIPIALQLWSIKSVIPNDVGGTLKKLAAMGYEGVETAGTYNLSGQEFLKLLNQSQLKCVGAHTGLNSLEGDELNKTIEFNKAIGNDILIVPSIDVANMEQSVQRINTAHEKVKKAGLKLGFHNHAKEFEAFQNTNKFDYIFDNTPKDFFVQLDIGWAAAANQNIPAILKKYNQRILSVHLKEYSASKPQAALGEGDVPWSELFPILESETGTQAYVIEQEKYEVGPMESVETCVKNFKKIKQNTLVKS